jgi:N-acyl-D-aspartate/D-glutamate deacylase
MPASVHGLVDRGLLREGAWADVLVIDPARLKAHRARLAGDFPAGTQRYVVESEGYVATLVNGQLLLEESRHTGALPGHVLV